MTNTRREGYWVISVDRKTGRAKTSRIFLDANTAWAESIKRATADSYTTVVGRRY